MPAVRWDAQQYIQMMGGGSVVQEVKIEFLIDKTMETNNKTHRPFAYDLYRGGRRFGGAGGGLVWEWQWQKVAGKFMM